MSWFCVRYRWRYGPFHAPALLTVLLSLVPLSDSATVLFTNTDTLKTLHQVSELRNFPNIAAPRCQAVILALYWCQPVGRPLLCNYVDQTGRFELI